MKKLLILTAIFLYLPVQAQTTDSLQRPKIGLVLSGGGAKGLAHIGVLKALESYGIRPDYIGGTSMGAIVGSMYAAGYSAEQIDSLLHTFDFDAVLYNRFDRKYLSNFDKERGKRFMISFPFSLKNMSVQLPRGLSDSQRLFNLLTETLLPVSKVEDFSELQTPFICLSTDIVTGNQVLFNKGYLPLAVTSSALLPSIYKPLDYQNKLLLDGGIVNNYPVQEVRDLGADFIIGSDVQGKILQKEDIKDMGAILEQIISFGMYKNMPLKKAKTDLYIRPDINGIGITDFDKIDTIISRGEQAALRKLKINPNLKKWQTERQVHKLHFQKPDSLMFERIILNGQNNFNRDYILGKIGVRPFHKISYKDFLDGINNLIGSDNFEKVHYRFKSLEDAQQLYIDLKEREDKAYMNLGFHYNNLDKINVIANFKNKRIFTNNDMISIDVIGGDYFRYNFDYLIDNGFKLSWGFHSGLHQFSHRINAVDLFAEENYAIHKLDFNYWQLTNKIYFQANLSHFLYLKIGMHHRFNKLYTYVFSSEENEAYYFGKNHYLGNFASVNFDSRNDFDFPTKGLYFNIKWLYNWTSSNFYGNFEPLSIYTFKLNWTQSILKNWYIRPEIKVGLHYGSGYAYDNIFYLGGSDAYINYDQIVAFDPLPVLSVSATKYAAFGFKNVINVYKNHFIDLGGHYLIYDKSNDFIPDFTNKLYGFNIGYGIKTFLGPVKINYGNIPDLERNHFSFSFGYNF